MAAGFQRNSLRHLDKSCLNNRSWNIYWGKVFNKRCFNLIYFIAPLNSIDQLTTILQTYWFSDRGWHSSQTTSYSYTTSSKNSSETPVEDNQFKLFVIDIYIFLPSGIHSIQDISKYRYHFWETNCLPVKNSEKYVDISDFLEK